MTKIALVMTLLLGACKSAPAPVPQPAGEDSTLYYPLAVGNSWTYALHGSDKRETIQIVGRDGPWFLDDHRGRLRYERDGVRDPDRYLLHTPLAEGAKWSAVEDLVVQRFEVTRMDASAVTEAGTFTRCAVVRNEQAMKAGKFVTETVDEKGKEQEQMKLQLVAYQVK